MSQEKFWVLLSKKLAGEATGTELVELENLIAEHPGWQYAIQNLEDLWKHQSEKDFSKEEDAYMLHLHRMNEKNIPFGEGAVDEKPVTQKRIPRLRLAWAAAALILITGALLLLRYLAGNGSGEEAELMAKEHNEVSTRPGSKTRVQLPDGSVVWLNVGSKLTYNKDFGKELREVMLTGEGFFDVKKMKEKPFIIHTSSIDIKVLGTVFNVKAYPEDKRTETSLLHGSIEVTIRKRPNDKIILSPSEKLVVENETGLQDAPAKDRKIGLAEIDISTLVSINKLKYNETDSAVAETQWIDNKLVFRDESFDELAIKMERWYNVKMEITDPVLLQRRVSGSFENETIEQALEALKIIVPFHYEHTGNKFIIHR